MSYVHDDLELEVPSTRFIAGMNTPGYIPDNEPVEFEILDDAKHYIISCIKWEEDWRDIESEAEELCHFAEQVNLQSGKFSAVCLGTCYWVTGA